MPPAVGSGCWASDRGYGARREAIERRAMRPPPRDFTDDERGPRRSATRPTRPAHRGPRAARVHRQPVVDARPWPRRSRRPATTSSCPGCPGHGTTIDDMLDHRWGDWTAEVEARLPPPRRARRHVVVAGLSMGGTLSLWTALGHPRRRRPRARQPGDPTAAAEVLAMLDRDCSPTGTEVVPGDRQRHRRPRRRPRSPTTGTPLAPLLSLLDDGLAPIADRYGELTVPLLLFTSRQDHVVEPGAQRATSPPRTAGRSTTAGSSAATTSRPRTTTATLIVAERRRVRRAGSSA